MFEIARKIALNEETFIETPLLIPSFSSKGFGFSNKGKSEIHDAFNFTKEQLTESLLVSAYDIYYKNIALPYRSIKPDITFLDSGGYEVSNFYDFSATMKLNYPIEKWTEKQYHKVINKWPVYIPLVIVNYDDNMKGKKITKQIEVASHFFSKYKNKIYDLLIKPEHRNKPYLNIDSICNNIKLMNKFHIIGVTEKELGASLLDRMINISKIRKRLNDEGLGMPIHVFGGLDPLSCIFYFLSGAEIFDGLTWLRYSYLDNVALYLQNYSILNDTMGIQHKDSLIKAKSLRDNLIALTNLKFLMRTFVSKKDFDIFGARSSSYLKDSYTTYIHELEKNGLIRKEDL